MAVTWKKVGLVGSTPNIGNENLTIPAGVNRTLSLDGSGGFDVLNSSGNALLALDPLFSQLGNTTDTQVISLYMPNTSMTMVNAARLVSFDHTNNFVIKSHADSAVAGPIVTLTRERGAAGGTDDDVIGKIDFKGDNDIGGSVSYASVETVIIDSDHEAESADLKFVVKDKNLDQNNFTITQVGTSTTSLTQNEADLQALKIRTNTLEVLTRRTQMVYQCGYNGIITSPTATNTSTEQMLRVSNGVQVIDGSNYAASTGIVMPFDGYIAGGSFSCVRSDSNGTYADDGDILFRIQKYTPDGTGQWDLLVATAAATTATNPVSTEYSISTVRSSGVTVAKGDILLPFVKVQTNESGTAYRIDDVIAQFVVYSEEVDQT